MELRQGYEKIERREAWRFGASMAQRIIGRTITAGGVLYRIDCPTFFTRDTESGRVAEFLWDLLDDAHRGIAILDALGIEAEETEEEMSFRQYAESHHVTALSTGVREELFVWVLAKDARDCQKSEPAPAPRGTSEQTPLGF